MKKINHIILFFSILFTSLPAIAQQVTVGGKIMDKENREELALVSIVVMIPDETGKLRTTNHGGASDLDGKFSLRAPLNSTLRFTYTGYEPLTWKVTREINDLHLFMVQADNTLQETVVIGLERKAKSDVTASYWEVKAEDLVQTPVANVMELLQGRVPGLNIQNNNGTPGMAGTYVIRGISDISVTQVGEGDNAEYYLGSSAPLFVIDGIPQMEINEFDAAGLMPGSGVSPLSMLPVEDIESMEILKDAAATSLYGSKGAYGVILINTKRGNSSRPVISYSNNFSIKTPPRLREVIVGAAERRSRVMQIMENDTSYYYAQYLTNSNPYLSDSLNVYFNNNTDWQDVFYRTTFNQTHNLSFSGGDKFFNYKVNANYFEEKGIVENTEFNRYTLRSNIGYNPNNKFSLQASINAGIALNSTGSGNFLSQKGVAGGSNSSSFLPPPSLYTASNEALGALSVDDDKTTITYEAAVNMTYKLPLDLSWGGTFGYTYRSEETETFTPGMLNNNLAYLSGYSSNSNRIYANTHISTKDYNIAFLKLGLLIGAELTNTKSKGNSVNLSGLASDNLWGPGGYSPSQTSGKAEAKSESADISFTFSPRIGIGNIGGSYAGNKYIITPTIRPEANSAYGSKGKWTLSPGLSARWNFSQESFMEKLDFLSAGFIRASWGKTTKYKADIYDVWGTYRLNSGTYNGSSVTAIDYNYLPNPDLRPITTTMWNLGTEMVFWNGKLTLFLEGYYKQVDNQIRDIEIANHNGFNHVKSSEVSLVNYGIETAVGTTLTPAKDLTVTANFNLSVNRDVITKLPNNMRQIIYDGANLINRVGESAFANYLYVYKGSYADTKDVPVDPATGLRYRVGGNTTPEAYFRAGDPVWVDVNGDYILDANDKMIVGNPLPRITGGLNFNIRYKTLSVHTNCSFTLRRDIMNKALSDRLGSYSNPYASHWTNLTARLPISAYDFWTPMNREATYPNPYDYIRADIINPFRKEQSLYMEDGSYFKINGISLTYGIKGPWLQLFRISALTFKASANNIHTFSKYSGINPENVTSLGYDDSGGYPNSRTWTFGFDIRF